MIFKKSKSKSKYDRLSDFLNKAYSLIQKLGNVNNGVETNTLLIYDDIYPNPISGFRYEEFNSILQTFDDATIFIDPTAYKWLQQDSALHRIHVIEILKLYPKFKNRIFYGKNGKSENAKLFYCVFFNNIQKNFAWLEEHRIPFVFTLYPGGGFSFNDKVVNEKLKMIFSSKLFRKVIVNQKIIRDYLLEHKLCPQKQIELIFGVVVPQTSIEVPIIDKEYFGFGKETLDICFCAAKYKEKGIDKGYDVFIDFAKKISEKYNFIRVHVIGGFNQDDIDASVLGNKITFYGYLNYQELKSVFSKTDLIISPNKPFELCDGCFDGFPLASIVEAVLNGVVALVADELDENAHFTSGEDVIIIAPETESIMDVVENLIDNPQKIKLISNKGRSKFKEIYSYNAQMKPRIKILNEELKNE